MEPLKDFLWVEKYRPKKISDTILPEKIKQAFKKFIDQNNVPNLLLCGSPGTGKTTAARAMLEEMGCEYIVINGSLSGNIDTLRNDIKNFASSVSLMKTGRKYVILDEADYLNANSTQPALRNFMEEYSKNCGFILTCNYRAKIMDALQSRCSIIEFKIPVKERASLATQFLKRIQEILDKENIEYDTKTVAAVISKFFPDWRRVLNELQTYSATGKIDSGILSNFIEHNISKLISSIKDKDFTSVRKWISENSDIEPVELFEKFYTKASELVDAKSIPIMVLILSRYMYQSAFVAHQEINTAACIVELMMECQFK
jgi:DNA polymerase III delta prime subunit